MGRLTDALYQQIMGNGALPFYETTLRGRNTFKYRAEFERTQWFSPDALAALQWERLSALLRHAWDTVEAYRAMFDALNATPDDIRTPDDFAHLPILDKPALRAEPERYLSTDFRREDLILSNTGGSTTGSPMRFYYNRDSYEWRTAAAMRGDGWAGWKLCAPEFYIWGMPLLPQSGFIRHKKLVHHKSLRRCVNNSFDLTPDKMRELAGRYERLKPRVVIGYTNAVYEFARFALEEGISLRAPEGVVCTAERLYEHQRSVIEAAFNTRVFNRYGCREAMMIGAECEEHAGLHATTDNLYIEVVRNGVPCGPGELGEVLITDLHNYGMPLIRYRVGDITSWSGEACPCGRGLPLLNPVEGRTLDMISTPSGRVVSGVFFPYLLKEFAWVKGYQAVQRERGEITIQIQTDDAPPRSDMGRIMGAVTRTLGATMRVEWEVGPDVFIEKTRKFRPVISHVPVDFTAQATEAGGHIRCMVSDLAHAFTPDLTGASSVLPSTVTSGNVSFGT